MVEPTTTIQGLLEDDLFEVVGLASLTDEEKAEYLSTMLQTVYARTLLQIELELDDADKEVFAGLHADQLVEFLKQRDLDLVGLLAEEAIRYRQEVIMTYLTARNQYLETELPGEAPLAHAA